MFPSLWRGKLVSRELGVDRTCSTLVVCKSPVRISVWTFCIYTDIASGCPKTLQSHAGMIPQMGHNHFQIVSNWSTNNLHLKFIGPCIILIVDIVDSGVVSLCRLKHCFSLHKDTTPPQPNHIVTPTHIEPEQYNTWNKSTISRKLLKMDVLTFETCWAVNSEIIKQVTSS